MNVGNVASNPGFALQAPQMRPPRPPPPKASEMAEDALSELDSAGKGYTEKEDFSALELEGVSNSTLEALFEKLDTDGDERISRTEFESEFTALIESFASGAGPLQHAQGSRAEAGHQAPPPPPPERSNVTEGRRRPSPLALLAAYSSTDTESASDIYSDTI